MVQYTLSNSDKERLIDEFVLTVDGLSDEEFDHIYEFLDNFLYIKTYRKSLFLKRPKEWTKAYLQAADRISCFFKYGDSLSSY